MPFIIYSLFQQQIEPPAAAVDRKIGERGKI
jgi:hypothetical protein